MVHVSSSPEEKAAQAADWTGRFPFNIFFLLVKSGVNPGVKVWPRIQLSVGEEGGGKDSCMCIS